jgi:predicted secreted Zn-dependent protease
MAYNQSYQSSMSQEQKNKAVKIIRAILSARIAGEPTANDIVQATYKHWQSIGGNTFDDFTEIIEALKGKQK